MSEDLSKSSNPRTITVQGRKIALDEDGFLVAPESWNKEIAEILAQEEGLTELSELHWRILKFLRLHYLSYGKTPLNSQLKKSTGLTMAEIHACFPGGIRKSTRRIAGLPNLKGCE